MPFVDRLLNAAIKYLQKKQKSLRHNAKKAKKAKKAHRRAKTKKKRAVARRPPPIIKGKAARAAVKVKKTVAKPSREMPAGVVTHYFSRIEVVVINLNKAGLKIGDTIRIKGKNGDFTQKVKSLQIESRDVSSAKKGALVGLKVVREAKVGDKVFLIG
jgi:hypothetical protein